MVTLREVAKRLIILEKRVKKIYKVLELAQAVYPLEWKQFNDLDKSIITILIQSNREGASTTEIAQKLNLENPKTVGRVVIYERLKRIAKISNRLKGSPFVISSHRKWVMNWDDYDFLVEKKET